MGASVVLAGGASQKGRCSIATAGRGTTQLALNDDSGGIPLIWNLHAALQGGIVHSARRGPNSVKAVLRTVVANIFVPTQRCHGKTD